MGLDHLLNIFACPICKLKLDIFQKNEFVKFSINNNCARTFPFDFEISNILSYLHGLIQRTGKISTEREVI